MSRPRRRGRDINGVLLLDKPQGMSSNDALQKVKRIYNANRAGHTGALDPLATGMLPICLGEAMKFSQYLLDSDKRYRVIARLGQRTDTSDADGQIVEERPVTFSAEQLAAALDTFRGDIEQIPSMYSALKYQGKKLYEYARQGIEVPREARPITVYELLFIRHEGNELELEIHCSKGTYTPEAAAAYQLLADMVKDGNGLHATNEEGFQAYLSGKLGMVCTTIGKRANFEKSAKFKVMAAPSNFPACGTER